MHLSRDSLEAFHTNQMDTEQMISFLEHVSSQDSFLQDLIDFEEQYAGISTPVYLKEQILSQAASPKIQAEKTSNTKTYKIQLFYWGLRTVIGVAAALILLFSLGAQLDLASFDLRPSPTEEFSQPYSMDNERSDYLYDLSRDISDGISDSSQKLTDYLNDISNKLLYGGN